MIQIYQKLSFIQFFNIRSEVKVKFKLKCIKNFEVNEYSQAKFAVLGLFHSKITK